MACRSISAIVAPGMRSGPSDSRRRLEREVARRRSRSPSQRTTARSIAFSSARTLPGHRWPRIFARAWSVKPSTRLWFSCGELAQEVVREHENVAAADAERRHLDVDDVESVVEVLAETARGHVGGEVAVRRGDEAHVDLDRLVAPHALERALLQHAQELHLRRHRDFADLVEEQRSAVRLLEAAERGACRRR